MSLHDPIAAVLLGIFFAGFVAGVIFAGFVVWLETRKWHRRNRSFVCVDFAGAGDDCAVYGHYEEGVMHIDHVEFLAPRP